MKKMATSSTYLLFLGIVTSVFLQCASQELVSCRLGQVCVLPCRYQGQLEMIDWTFRNNRVLSFVNNRIINYKHPLFYNRTSLSEGLSTGDASLLLSQVSVKDQGTFRCFTSSSEGDQSVSLQLSVFAPVLDVSMEQEGQLVWCRSENIFPRPVVTWSSSSRHDTTVTESETGLFSVNSSVALTDSVDTYICNISTEHNWRRSVLQIFRPMAPLQSPHKEGPYTCFQRSDTESVILHIQKFTPSTQYLIIAALIGAAIFGVISVFIVDFINGVINGVIKGVISRVIGVVIGVIIGAVIGSGIIAGISAVIIAVISDVISAMTGVLIGVVIGAVIGVVIRWTKYKEKKEKKDHERHIEWQLAEFVQDQST